MRLGKWIGGGLGWAFGGPIGGIIGFAIGAMLDNTTVVRTEIRRDRINTAYGDFIVSLLVLSTAVMKVDEKILKSELDYVKQFFRQQFGVQKTQEIMLMFKEILKKNINLYEVCGQIRFYMHGAEKLQLIHFLFGIALADGQVHKKEVEIIELIANELGINKQDFVSIKAMFYKDTDNAYKILEINADATDEEIKKAYRRMALKYHPDRVSHLGEEFQKAAKEKFQKLQEAYETIKKERRMA